MRIQHNIAAMSSYRNYTNNVNAVNKNLEKLSSGYKINRAGDDAAGLAISEKMRAQITGLDAAQKNAKDGVSLVKTAEGALQEVHDMLNRMVYLATQSANGTYDNDVDRYQLQKEVDQLRSEINRIADSANFNGIKLLDGSMDGGTKVGEASNIYVAPEADGNQSVREGAAPVYSFDVADLKLLGDTKDGTATITKLIVGGKDITIGACGTDADFDPTALAASIVKATDTTSIVIDGMTYKFTSNGSKITMTGVSVPSTVASYATTEMTVSVVLDTAGGGTTTNNSFDLAVHVDTPPEARGIQKVAQGSFAISKANVQDGAQITIGKDTYTFKVGKDSEVSGSNIIDLSDYEADDANLVRAAAHKLSQQSNSMFDITTKTVKDGSATATLYLTEKVGAVDYNKDWDLEGTAAAKNGKWNDSVEGKGIGVVRFAAATTGTGKSLTLQIGDTADKYNQLKVNVGDAHCAALGIDKISIANQEDAATAIDKIKAAINTVSDIRGTLGATQNRLEHTQNNLSVMKENIQDAESTIRDTDIAEEMMAYTKNNILVQSAQAMLAQANQIPQGVLQLLG